MPYLCSFSALLSFILLFISKSFKCSSDYYVTWTMNNEHEWHHKWSWILSFSQCREKKIFVCLTIDLFISCVLPLHSKFLRMNFMLKQNKKNNHNCMKLTVFEFCRSANVSWHIQFSILNAQWLLSMNVFYALTIFLWVNLSTRY